MELFGIDLGCSYESLNNGHLPDKDCLLPLLSKILGYCLIATSTTVKLPQILKILRHKSIEGLSVVASELEVVGYTIGVAYCFHKGLPFSAFGEFVFILIQAIILLSILYYYSQPLGLKTWTKIFLYCVVAYIILAGQIDPVVFEALYASKHVIFLLARVPQIWKNFKNKSTGQLSSLTISMNLGGSTVRVFTGIQVKAPTTVLLGSFIAIIMNSTLLSQILFYKKPVVNKEKKIE